MKNLLTICAFIFLSFLSLGHCGHLDEYYEEPRIYIQTQNYTINLFPLIIPLAAFTLGKKSIFCVSQGLFTLRHTRLCVKSTYKDVPTSQVHPRCVNVWCGFSTYYYFILSSPKITQ